jgi:D-alanyl-D-alanine carboxypeptidase (penicillin-binding protein 5/6)
MAYSHPTAVTTRHTALRRFRAAGALLVVGAIGAFFAFQWLASPASTATTALDPLRPGQPRAAGPASTSTMPTPLQGTVWPAYGQAAFVESGQSQIQSSPHQHPAPIASVSKVMTAYVVLRDHPLQVGEEGPAIRLTEADLADTGRRRAEGESVVPVAAREQLTELQALQALLVPSANNIAAVLARWDAGSVKAFVAEMNATAESLGMTETRYTDPSGFDDTTVSTASDQVRVVGRAMRLAVFASIVATPAVTLPVAGTVHNTDTLLGHGGFVGVKTGSDSSAGGCFAFGAIRQIDGTPTLITGVVLGQPGHDQIAAALEAAAAMVDHLGGERVAEGPGQPSLAAPPPP